MANFGFRSVKDQLAVENLLAQTNDLYVLEQVAAINLSGFADSSLPSDLETRFRRLKSLPDPVSSSSSSSKKKLLSQSKSFASTGSEKRNFSGNLPNPSKKNGKIGSSACRFSQEPKIFPSEIKRKLSMNSSFRSGDLSDSGKIGSSSCRSSRVKKPRFISSSSFTSVDLSEPIPEEQGSNRESKPKSKLSLSWFNKLSPVTQAIGCLFKSKNTTKKTFPKRDRDTDFDKLFSDFGEFSVEEQKKMLKNAITESRRMRREAAEIIKTRK